MSQEKKSLPNYTNPPVQEVGIIFSYTWSDINLFSSAVADFITQNKPDILSLRLDYQLIPTTDSEFKNIALPDDIKDIQTIKRLIGINVLDTSQTKNVNISLGRFQFSSTRNKDNIPRYSAVSNDIFHWYESFASDYSAISKLELYYKDKIVIPTEQINNDSKLYFNLAVNLPKNFPIPQAFTFHSQPKDKSATEAFSLELDHFEENANSVYHLNWHLERQLNDGGCNKNEIIECLDKMHQILYDRFNELITDKCKRLFD